jgi:predicted protein tyrosine phosphatase
LPTRSTQVPWAAIFLVFETQHRGGCFSESVV